MKEKKYVIKIVDMSFPSSKSIHDFNSKIGIFFFLNGKENI